MNATVIWSYIWQNIDISSDIGQDNLAIWLFLSQTFNDIHYLSSFFNNDFPIFFSWNLSQYVYFIIDYYYNIHLDFLLFLGVTWRAVTNLSNFWRLK